MSEKNLKPSEPPQRPARGYPSAPRKVGLALSGGGLRAAFFHLGMLAHLADNGVLRHVEVISAVSGGSIIATLYYLHVKQLLESTHDSKITDADYRSIIERMEQQFLAAVERNFRLSTFVSIRANWKMRRPDYSRTDRIGELYDAWLFRPALAESNGHRARKPIALRDLKIFPAGSDSAFHPRRHNTSRAAKVPILLINSTNLNTGRNWRFEASRMGESPPRGKERFDIDKMTRLERPVSYDELPDHLARLPLGKAVAASTAVPGLLHPLPLSGLYPKRRLQLVDGGTHDNQGLQGLLDEGCNLFIVSDASAQIEEIEKPAPSWGPVLIRANGILMSRVREEQLVSRLRRPSFAVAGNERMPRPLSSQHLALIHMKKGLTPEHVAYRRSRKLRQPSESGTRRRANPTEAAPERSQPTLNDRVQKALARVRTDLDSFTEVEAFSLMADGYLVSEAVLPHTPAIAKLRRLKAKPPANWRFLAIEPWLHHPTPNYLKHLQVASGSLFKVFRLAPFLSWCVLACLLLCFGLGMHLAGGWDGLTAPQQMHISWTWGAALSAAALGLGAILAWGKIRSLAIVPVEAVYRPLAWMGRLLFQAVLPTIGAVFIKLYLLTFDRIFLAAGRYHRLKPTASVRQRRAPAARGSGSGSGINRYPT